MMRSAMLRSTGPALESCTRLSVGALRNFTPLVRGESSRPIHTTPSTVRDATTTPLSSVRPEEIAHFSKLSSQWWNEQGEFGLLHAMNPVRIEFMRQKMREVEQWESSMRAVKSGAGRGEDTAFPRQFLQDLDVLDVGCGGGLLSESLARLGANTTGLDAAEANIGIASLHASKDPTFSTGQLPLQYRHGTAEEVQSEGKTYDVVAAMEVLEHVNEPRDFLRTLSNLVKPGGHLFMSTISRNAFAYFLTILMAEHVLRLVTPGTHTYSQYIKPEELVSFFRNDVGWHAPAESQPKGAMPERLLFETRGVAYLPWKSTWELAPRGSTLGQQCNYFFWIRKPML